MFHLVHKQNKEAIVRLFQIVEEVNPKEVNPKEDNPKEVNPEEDVVSHRIHNKGEKKEHQSCLMNQSCLMTK